MRNMMIRELSMVKNPIFRLVSVGVSLKQVFLSERFVARIGLQKAMAQ
jgi:hypothetical protein